MGLLGSLFAQPEVEDQYEDDYYENEYSDNYDTYQNDPEPAAPAYDGPKVQPIRTVADMQIATVKPSSYEDAARIADMLRDMKLVVMNIRDLKENAPDDIWRILDFLSGVAYSEDGHILKASEDVYIAAPYFVDLIDRSSLEDRARNEDMLYY